MSQMMKSAIFVEPGRIVLDDKPLPDVGSNDALFRITHRFPLEQIEEAYELFASQRDGVLKIAITP